MQKTIYANSYGSLLKWLREKRLEQHLTLRDMGKRLNVHHSWVGRVEIGERRLDLLEYIKFCDALGLDPEEGIQILRNNM